MLRADNREFDRPIRDADEVTRGRLLALLADHPDKRLVFHYEGAAVKPGYQVTEVKAGAFSALDGGANFEEWTEIFVQLWDVDEGGTDHMPARKFSAIVRKVTEAIGLDLEAKLTFEVSDAVQPMQIFRASAPRIAGDAVRVELSPRPANCKPRDRWLEPERPVADVSSCCAPSQKGCCRSSS